MPYNRNLNSHPLTLETYRNRWAQSIRYAERNIARKLNILQELVSDSSKIRENASSIAYYARHIQEQEKEIDAYQRLIDGRPTAEEERRQWERDFMSRMEADAHRERNGGWGEYELNARYDSVRERFSGEW
jgi:hypothetical protein